MKKIHVTMLEVTYTIMEPSMNWLSEVMNFDGHIQVKGVNNFPNSGNCGFNAIYRE